MQQVCICSKEDPITQGTSEKNYTAALIKLTQTQEEKIKKPLHTYHREPIIEFYYDLRFEVQKMTIKSGRLESGPHQVSGSTTGFRFFLTWVSDINCSGWSSTFCPLTVRVPELFTISLTISVRVRLAEGLVSSSIENVHSKSQIRQDCMHWRI